MAAHQPWLFEAPLAHEAVDLARHAHRTGFETDWVFEAPLAQFETQNAPSTVPALLAEETSPPDKTFYVNIDLGIPRAWTQTIRKKDGTKVKVPRSTKVPTMTGIFVPKGYRFTGTINMILYLHGHHPGYKNSAYPDTLSIRQLWDARRYPTGSFREDLTRSGENLILVAPTLGPVSQAGWLTGRASGLDDYLDLVMAAIGAYAPFRTPKSTPKLGNLVLAAHSGGGARMQTLATSKGKYSNRICECWAFDAMYGGSEAWYDWAARRKKSTLYNHYLAGQSTESESSALRKLADGKIRGKPRLGNVFSLPSDAVDHYAVPMRHWVQRIQRASLTCA
jgi:hypothetical protein